MKTVFLDIDGVCNNLDTRVSEWPDLIDGANFDQFVRILRETDCDIVISSDWRHDYTSLQAIYNRLESVGLRDRVLDLTPYISGGSRTDEISAWFNLGNLQFNDIEKFAILDDLDITEPELKRNHFQTSYFKGLTKEIADKVIGHLNAA